VSDTSTSVLAIKVGSRASIAAESVATHLSQHIKGRSVAMTPINIARLQDIGKLRKVYKFDPSQIKSGVPTTTMPQSTIAFVLGTMALKGS